MSRPINENSEPAHRYGQVLSLSMSRYRLFRAYAFSGLFKNALANPIHQMYFLLRATNLFYNYKQHLHKAYFLLPDQRIIPLLTITDEPDIFRICVFVSRGILYLSFSISFLNSETDTLSREAASSALMKPSSTNSIKVSI